MEYFSGYGSLAFLPVRAYFSGDWEYVGYAYAPDGQEWDIVRTPDNTEYRYTKI